MPKNESHIKMCFIVYLAFPGLALASRVLFIRSADKAAGLWSGVVVLFWF